MKITAKQIAAKAGVSQATVSLVLHGKPGVSDEVRRQVLNLAKEAGFLLPSERPLIGQNIQLVIYKRHGKVVADTPFFDQLMQGVFNEAASLGQHLSVSYFYGSQPEQEQIQALRSLHCAGIILLATEMRTGNLESFRDIGCPIVLLDNYFPSSDYDSVVIDNMYGAWRAVRYLIDCGHTRIGYLHSNVDIRNFRERHSGYLSAVHTLPEEASRDAARRIIRVRPSDEEAYEDMKAYLRTDPLLPTAFFADNDRIAVGCCKALQNFGYQIPRNVSVIGFDDSQISETLTPSLTTMQVQKQRLGALAVDRLYARMTRTLPETLRTALVPEVLVRESVFNRTR